VVNKWDLAKGYAGTDDYADYLTRTLPGLDYAPLAFTTATEARNVPATVDLARVLHKQAHTRVATAALNRVLRSAMKKKQPPSPTATLPKVYYATQVAVVPPTIVLFVNHPDLFTQSYRRFIENRMRDELPFAEVPIRILFRAHRPEDGSPKGRRSERRSSGKKR
jgi:GTP-binding protein